MIDKLRSNQNNIYIKNEYIYWRNKLTNMKKIKKKQYNGRKFEEAGNDQRKLWAASTNIIYNYNKNKTTKANILSSLNEIDKKSKLNDFNEFFITIGENLTRNMISNYTRIQETTAELHLQEINITETINIINKLKNTTSEGPDRIQTKVIKSCQNVLADNIQHIINQSIRDKSVPQHMKITKTIPIYKNGNIEDLSNYRPISIIPIIDKILETHINNQLISHLEENQLLFSHQYGFRKKSSTNNAIFDMITLIQSKLDKGLLSSIIYIDIKKAFDTVDRQLLLIKLKEIGLDEDALNWFQSYLNDRKQYMQHDDINSDTKSTNCGVPQGSILGPTLFLIYINNIKHLNLNGNLFQYADDIALVYSAKTMAELTQQMNEDMDSMKQWMDNHKLTVNIGKTKYMFFNQNRDTTLNILYDGSPIEKIDEYQYLGMYITTNLKWEKHTQHIKKKINPIAGIFRKIQNDIPHKMKRSIFFSLFHSHIQYGITTWACSYDNIIDNIQKVQNKAIKNLYGQPFRTHTNLIHNQFKILPIKEVYKLYAKIQIHDIRNNFILSNTEITYNNQIHHYNTRTNHHIHTDNNRTRNFGINSIFKTASTLYNDLNNDLKILNKQQFKNNLKRIAYDNNLNI
jgi:Reverse transcriptase (RNA-dependent DNA polymerase)